MRRQLLLSVLIAFLLNLSSNAQTLIDPAGDGGFETGTDFAANGWTVVNGGGGNPNQWHVGNPTGVGATGARAAFISNNGGTTYAYTNTTASVSHFYRDITIPANTQANLSFRWKSQGEAGYDYLRVFLVPTATTPTAGTQLTSGQVGGNFQLQNTWQTVTNLSLFCNTTGSPVTRRLVFSWRNDWIAGTNPPAAVDDISVVASPIPACNLGTGVTNVAALPYNSGAGTTCGQVNDLTSSNTVTCGSSSYLGGEDAVWVFTAPSSGAITINLTSSGSWTGLMVYDGCPVTTTTCPGTCIAQAQSSSGSKSLCFNATAGVTYYVVLDVFPTPNCNAYTNLSISAPVTTCALGTGVTNVPSLPYNSGPGTTCGQADDLTSSNTVACGSSIYLGGEDAVWVFTAPSSGAITINLTSSGSSTGLMVYNGCPVTCSPTPGTCIAQAQSSSGSKSLCFNATAGVTYYVVLDVFPTPNCNAYTNLSISAPVTTCPLGTGVTNVPSLPYNSGPGTTCGQADDLTSFNTVACGSSSYLGGEDAVWVFTAPSNGIITINLTSSGSRTGLMVYNGCPATCVSAPGTCIAQRQSSPGSKSLCFNATAGVTYYLVLDVSPTPNCNAYTNLSISAPAMPTTCALGTGVTNVPSLPYNSGPGTTCGQADDLTSSNTVACGSSSYLGGEDAVWVFTAPSSGAITIDLTSSGSSTGLMVYNGCPVTTCSSASPGTCIAQTQSSSGDKSLCFSATAGVTYYVVLDVFPTPNCNAYTNLSISAPVASPNSCTLAGTYTMSSIPHNPDVLTSPNLSGFTDDIFYPGGNINTGFDFCLNGNQYQNFLISANGYVIFATPDCSVTNLPSGSNAVAGGYSGWSITANIPNTSNAPRNAILAPWHDINPSITSNGANPIIRYQVFGTAPNRRFVVSWENVPMFSSSCDGDRTLDFTGQIKMFETTNDIEIHVTRKRLCPSWNNGRAILGLHNYNGTQALVPAGRNALDPNWTATNEAYRFTFNPTACTTCSPLPLNLMFFTGSWDKQRLEAHLQWAFKDQKDVMYYILEHSTDEKNFKEIAQIPVKSENFYTFAHTNPAKGRNFYRLQKVSKNQSTEKSHYVTVVNPIAEVWQIENVYPNPTNMQAINLDINSLENQELILKLINLQGVQVSEQKYMLEKGHNSIYFEMKQAPKGTYLLVCQTPTQIETRKIVVE